MKTETWSDRSENEYRIVTKQCLGMFVYIDAVIFAAAFAQKVDWFVNLKLPFFA